MSMSLITQDGDSALMQAANTEVAVELVTAGANLNLQNAVCQLWLYDAKLHSLTPRPCMHEG